MVSCVGTAAECASTTTAHRHPNTAIKRLMMNPYGTNTKYQYIAAAKVNPKVSDLMLKVIDVGSQRQSVKIIKT